METTSFFWHSGLILQLSIAIVRLITTYWVTFNSKIQKLSIGWRTDLRLLFSITIASILLLIFGIGAPTNIYILTPAVCSEIIIYFLFNALLTWFWAESARNQIPDTSSLYGILVFFGISGSLLFGATNLLYAFFVIELMGFTVLYAFLVLNTRNPISITQTMSNIVASLIYQFTLNFASSLIFYAALTMHLYFHGTHSLNSTFILIAAGPGMLSTEFILLALFIKFGVGPWVFFKVSIYRAFNLLTLGFYTVTYFAALLIFLINLFTGCGISVTFRTLIVLLITVITAIVFFSTAVFQSNNIMLFLGISSLLNLTMFILQLFCIFA